jgi:hypothetical protein
VYCWRFNALLSKNERKGKNVCCNKVDITEFTNFVENMEVINVSAIETKYSWCSSNDRTVNKCVKYLISEFFFVKMRRDCTIDRRI